MVGRVGLAEDGEALCVPLPVEAAAVDDGAANRGAMATDVLGERMHDDVGPMLEGAAQVGGRHRVVDDERHAMSLGHLGPALQVHHVAGRVTDRFAVKRTGVVINGRFQRLQIVVVHEAALDALVGQAVCEQVVGAAVQLTGGDDVAARRAQCLQRIGDGRHARSQRQRTDAALQGRHARLQHRIGGVHDARVDVAGHRQVEEVRTMLAVVEGVRGGLIDRHGGRPGGGVAVVAGVDGGGGKFHESLLR